MKYLIFLFFVSTTTLAQSSKDKTIYLDSLFFPTTKKEFKYYMIVEDYKNTKPEYFITIYYASGKIESKGYSKSKDFFKKKGEIISYYENETIKSTIFFEDNFPNGKCVLYFENGEKKMEGRYLLTTDIGGKRKSKLRIENAWNIDKLQVVTDGTGDYEEDEFFIVHNNNYYLNSISKGQLKNGYKDGEWKGINTKHNYTFSEIYKSGDLISGESVDKNNKKYFYTATVKLPEPNLGFDYFYKHFGDNFNIPNIEGFKGEILLYFIINDEGVLINPKVIKSIGNTDDEAIRALKSYTKGWTIGQTRGIKNSFPFTFPIKFHSP